MIITANKLPHTATYFFIILTVIAFSSCSKTDYINAIPGESTALVSMDLSKLNSGKDQNLLKTMIHITDQSDCGLDISDKVYLFESPDGNLGLCAKVSDKDKLEDFLNNLSKLNVCGKIIERRGISFTILKGSWVLGASDNAMIVMGPATVSAQAKLRNDIAQYLKQDEEEGIKGSPMFDKIDSISSPMAIVAQAKALPEKFIAPFTLGIPKDTDPSDVLISAEIHIKDGCLTIYGQSSSLNTQVDKALKEALKVYQPIKGEYTQAMSSDLLGGIFMNVDGEKFLRLIQNDAGLQALLTGINTAIDMDNIIKSVNGDMFIGISPDTQISINAELGNSNWLKDVDYWKQSCPQGSHIYDWNKNAYYYTNGKTTFYFGVSDDKQLYSGSTAAQALASLHPATHGIPENVQRQITGKKMAMVMNINAAQNQTLSSLTTFLTPVFGKINKILYIIK